MIAALVAALAVTAALVALATWLVSIIRADGRERAAALVLAEKLQGEINLVSARVTPAMERLAADLRRQRRRADALEDFIRSDLMRRHGAVDDGTDLLLAELSIVAEGPDGDPDAADTPAAGNRSDAGGTVFVDPATLGSSADSGEDADRDGDMPEGEPR